MLHAALSAFYDAVNLLLKGVVEKRTVLENLDLVLLALDETVDDGCVDELLGASSTPACRPARARASLDEPPR